MSESNGSKRSQIELAAVGFLTVAFIVGLLLWAVQIQATINHQSVDNTEGHRLRADKHIQNRCIKLPQPAHENCVESTRAASEELEREERDLEAQKVMALWTAVMGAMAVIGVGLSGFGVYLIWRTWVATRTAANTSQKTYQAFIDAEDASLLVEFPTGTMIETAVNGTMQADHYFLDPVITNIGRSTARIQGWSVNDGEFKERERTIKPGETWAIPSQIDFISSGDPFKMSIRYSSPLRAAMVLEVNAKVKSKKQRNGAVAYYAKVGSSLLTPQHIEKQEMLK